MKWLLTIILIFWSILSYSQDNFHYLRLTNFESNPKYIMVRYQDINGVSFEKEFKINPDQECKMKIYGEIFYIYSVSYNKYGKMVYTGIHGSDGNSYMKKYIKGKRVYFKKIIISRCTKNILDTVHLGV